MNGDGGLVAPGGKTPEVIIRSALVFSKFPGKNRFTFVPLS